MVNFLYSGEKLWAASSSHLAIRNPAFSSFGLFFQKISEQIYEKKNFKKFLLTQGRKSWLIKASESLITNSDPQKSF